MIWVRNPCKNLTCGYVHRPGEQLLMRGIGVVQPKVVLRAGQSSGELDVLANLAGRDRGVRLRKAKGRTVVDPVEGIVVAARIWHINHQLSCICVLKKDS